MITSQMCHTFIVVKKIASKPTRYRVSVVAKAGVPAFSPFLSFPNEFEKSDKLRLEKKIGREDLSYFFFFFLRQFLLAKALNGNRATFQAKTFLQKTKRTRKDLLARMLKDLNDENVLQNSPTIVFSPDAEPSPILLSADNVQLKVEKQNKGNEISVLKSIALKGSHGFHCRRCNFSVIESRRYCDCGDCKSL